MSYTDVPAGGSPPDDINVIIEIPAYSAPVKYEADKDWNLVVVDRFMPAPMFYPANYGFIPNSYADDGDPLDVLVITPHSLIPGCVVRSRPVGTLRMSDEEGEDAKIIAVPHSKLTPVYDKIEGIVDVPELLKQQIEHFFENYKKLEKSKWVKIDQWEDKERAFQMIKDSLKPQGA